jgi:TldD protein
METDCIEKIKPRLEGFFRDCLRSYSACRYADLRIQWEETRWATAEDGKPRGSGRDVGCSVGIRVLAGDGLSAPGYWGGMLSAEADGATIEDELKRGIDHAYHRAAANARRKSEAAGSWGELGRSLQDIPLAPAEVHRDTVPAAYRVHPLSVSLKDIQGLVFEVSHGIRDLSSRIRFHDVSAYTQFLRHLFVSTEGAFIDQSFAFTQGGLYVVAGGKEGTQESYEVLGDQAGWEVLSEGANSHGMDLKTFARSLSREALDLADAPPLKSTEKEVVVVTDPHYNTLLSHEILGHPSEADRILKYETAYAGRSWFFRNLSEHYIGKQIASPLVGAFSDPSLPGYGHYKYDHEGVRGKRVAHIEKGILKGFMNSRQTAAILGMEANGSYTATDPVYVPLIRMSTTVFAPGDRPPEEIIREVDDGYYFAGMRTPSISESRENFNITARKVYRIRRGELRELYRNGGITADSGSFLMQVDAVGNDFKIYPVPNCGKGQPMQTKRLGNGGPTLRSRARLTGGA